MTFELAPKLFHDVDSDATPTMGWGRRRKRV
jgi:hypothetical protein